MYFDTLLLSVLASFGSLQIACGGSSRPKPTQILDGANIAKEVAKERHNREYKIGFDVPGRGRKDIVFRATSAFSEDTTVIDADGVQRPPTSSTQTLIPADGEETFALLSLNLLNLETQGIMKDTANGKTFRIGQRKDLTVTEADEFTPPAWDCTQVELGDDHREEHLTEGVRDLHERASTFEDHNLSHHIHLQESKDPMESLLELKASLRGRKGGQVGRKLYYTDQYPQTYTYQADLHIEIDQQFVSKVGTFEAAEAKVEFMVSGLNSVFEKEVDTHLNVKTVEVVTRYDSETSTSGALSVMRSAWSSSTRFTEEGLELHHALLGRGIGGGIAYLSVLCRGDYGFGVSSGISGNFMTMDSAVMWDIFVFGHELGHNFGSGHTHNYSPKVDTCYDEGTGQTDCTGTVSGGATFMSYCHLCGYSTLSYTFGGYRPDTNVWVDDARSTGSSASRRVPQTMYNHVKQRFDNGYNGYACLSPPSGSNIPIQEGATTTTTTTPTTTTTTTTTATTTPTTTTITTTATTTPTTTTTTTTTPTGVVEIAFDDFESGWGNYNDGGSDARRWRCRNPCFLESPDNFSPSGLASLRIRDDSETSVVTLDATALGTYDRLKVSFCFRGESMEATEKFVLEYQELIGTTELGWSEVGAWASQSTTDENTDIFENGVVYCNESAQDVEIVPSGGSANLFQIRFRCVASQNNDAIYIDDVNIEGIYIN